eukprot:10139276-Lingulodinium_polyedra.AAC.1
MIIWRSASSAIGFSNEVTVARVVMPPPTDAKQRCLDPIPPPGGGAPRDVIADDSDADSDWG